VRRSGIYGASVRAATERAKEARKEADIGLLSITVAVSVMHLMLWFPKSSWQMRAILSLGAAILAGGLMMSFAPLRRPFNLIRANLSDQLFSRLDLKEADFEGANLVRTRLMRVDLTSANFLDANLANAESIKSNFARARFYHSNLTGASLGDNLTGAQFVGADLTHANLSGTDLTGAILYANLTDASLSSANLTGADLHLSFLTDTDFRAANLDRANLSNLNVRADLADAILKDANFSGADLSNCQGLTQQQLDTACGDAKTTLPPGLNLPRTCP
jgi:uncharacterized protein YjbI with pentapeptide repeats